MTETRINLRRSFEWLWTNRSRLALADYRERRADLLDLSRMLAPRPATLEGAWR